MVGRRGSSRIALASGLLVAAVTVPMCLPALADAGKPIGAPVTDAALLAVPELQAVSSTGVVPASSGHVHTRDASSIDKPSGSLADGGHTVTWNVTGFSPLVQVAGQDMTNFQGVVYPGQTLKFSGETRFEMAAGRRPTKLSMSASISGYTPYAIPEQAERFAEREVTSGSYAMPFDLAYTVPAATEPTAGVRYLGFLRFGTQSGDRNPFGEGEVVWAEVKIAVLQGAAPSQDTSPPVVTVSGTTTPITTGKPIPAKWQVVDNSGKAAWHATLYSGGTRVATGNSKGLVNATKASVWNGTWPATVKGIGPFYYCFWAEDAAGNRSARAPYSACAWLSRQVSIPSVSNGCGTSEYGPTVAAILNWFGDMQFYGGIPVNVRLACNQHDAAYAGVTVGDTTTKKITDYRTMTREAADQKFYGDIIAACRKALAGKAALLEQCRQDAYKYTGLVRKFGTGAYDANVTKPGVQTTVPTSTTPAGGARSNR